MEIQTEADGFYKTGNGVILNKDSQALHSYKTMKKRNAMVDMLEKKIISLEDRVLFLENKLKDL